MGSIKDRHYQKIIDKFKLIKNIPLLNDLVQLPNTSKNVDGIYDFLCQHINSLECYLYFEHNVPLNIALTFKTIIDYLKFRDFTCLPDLDNETSKVIYNELSIIKSSNIFTCIVLLSDNYLFI